MAIQKKHNSSVPRAFKDLFSLLTYHQKCKWVWIISFALIVSLLEVLTASLIVVFAQVLNNPAVGQKALVKYFSITSLNQGQVIFYISLIIGGTFLIKNIVAAVEIFHQNFAIQKMSYLFKNKLLHRFSLADYSMTLTRNTSYGLQVVGAEAEQAFSCGMVAIAGILSESIIFCFLLGMLIYMNPELAVFIFIIGGLLSFTVAKYLLPKFYNWGLHLQETGIQTSKNLIQFFHGFKEIILLGKRKRFVDLFSIHSKQRSVLLATHNAVQAIPRMIIETVFVGLFVITISYLGIMNATPGKMLGILGGYLYAGFRLMPGLNRIITQLNTFKSVIPSIERVAQEYHSIAKLQNFVDIPNFKFTKSININAVDYHYPNVNKRVLSNINLTINKGDCIGIIGETGSGKSTLIDIILGLLKPTKGTVLIDNKFPANSKQWHSHVGYVPQNLYLIDDTIEANIAFGEEYIDKTKLDSAIKAAQLTKFIDNQPLGCKTIVGERGLRISGGERQRIAIARALYHDPDVLVFDEATSALDSKTEAKLIDTINIVSKTRTVIMIAHRLQSLKFCKRFIRIQSGEMVEVDTKQIFPEAQAV